MRSCTIALDNEDLVKALIRRRKLILELRNRLQTDDFDSDKMEELVALCPPTPLWKKILCCSSDADVIYQNIRKEDVNIDDLSRKEYNVSSVFVIFETEEAQRKVLKALSPPLVSRPFIDESMKFNGVTLDVRKTEEPDAIRWDDLHVSFVVSQNHFLFQHWFVASKI